MIKILKASAGSGKTYTLSHEYIDMLLSQKVEGTDSVWDEFAYRGILAVTFTNKATDEMKSRILKELHTRAKKNDAKAARALHNILHDYSAFAVSTIDKFFQQTLRAFARELGQYASYQVELDKELVTSQAVDTILDTLDKNSPEDLKMVDFILENMEQRVESGHSYDMESGLKDMARSLKSEAFTVKAQELGLDISSAYSQEELLKLKKACLEQRRQFEKEAARQASSILQDLDSAGLEPSSFSRGWIAPLNKLLSDDVSKYGLQDFSDAFKRRVENPDEWFAKANAGFLPVALETIGSSLPAFMEFWDREFKKYNTAAAILENIYGLGIAARLNSVFEQIMAEKNMVCLDESNHLLKEIIAGSDAPFVYEKVGARIQHYLLDEFQDTSVTQWDNFLPLLQESNAHDGSREKVNNLIVGDVKQSIYRWRESDWNLLDNVVQSQFPEAQVEAMPKNYRSFQEVVDFNNALYPFIAASLDNEVPDGFRKISEIYADVAQKVGKKEHKGKGYVQVKFVEEADDQTAEVLEKIKKLHDGGMPYSDIAVLVRNNDSGTIVARALIEEGISVVTESSLRLSNSVSVRRLVSLMSYVDNPSNKINGYLARSFSLEDVPTSYHSLPGLCDSLYTFLCRDEECRLCCDSEVMYITAFSDLLLDFSQREGNNLHAFLDYWKDKSENLTISSPLGGDAVKILSIHKSKGLDFTFVIVPFIERIILYNSQKTSMWCSPELPEGELGGASRKLFHVGLSAKSEQTAFASSYSTEKYNQMVDAVNLLYVATTRASQGMMLLGCTKKASGNMVGLLQAFTGGDKEYGTVNFVHPEDKEERCEQVQIGYSMYDLAGRLSVRPYAEDFFSGDDGTFENMTSRQKGIVYHDILGRVRYASDLDDAVDQAVEEGLLPSADASGARELLARAIAGRPDIFPDAASGTRVLLETPVVNAQGEEKRPDRVLIYPDGRVRIYDYKFGAHRKEYDRQIAQYSQIYRALGHTDVKAELWFVNQN